MRAAVGGRLLRLLRRNRWPADDRFGRVAGGHRSRVRSWRQTLERQHDGVTCERRVAMRLVPGVVDLGTLGHDALAVEDDEVVLDGLIRIELRERHLRNFAEVLAVDKTPVGRTLAAEVGAEQTLVCRLDLHDRHLAGEHAAGRVVVDATWLDAEGGDGAHRKRESEEDADFHDYLGENAMIRQNFTAAP